MLTEMTLRGEKVALREKRLSDAPDEYRWRTDGELARLDAASPFVISLAEFLRAFEEELRNRVPWSHHFAIETLDGVHIGSCMYYDVDHVNSRTELGILIGERKYWGRGYGSDAVMTLAHYILTSTPLRCVYLHTLEWNVRARRAFEKSGFAPVKRVHRNGQDFIYMEAHREPWLKWWREVTAHREGQGKSKTDPSRNPKT